MLSAPDEIVLVTTFFMSLMIWNLDFFPYYPLKIYIYRVRALIIGPIETKCLINGFAFRFKMKYYNVPMLSLFSPTIS